VNLISSSGKPTILWVELNSLRILFMDNSKKNKKKPEKIYYVYVISKNGKPLMPTKRYKRVRILLKTNKAVVVRRKPFTIKLLYDIKEYVQELTLGIDPGSKKIAVVVRKNNGKIVFSGELETRKEEVKENMTERKMYRRLRRRNRRKKLQRRAKKNKTAFKEKHYKIKNTNELLCCKYIKPNKIRFFREREKNG
jgi:activator of 2-hydroxyglutaryl-CoA dehydratase